MRNIALITVRDVEASARWYEDTLGLHSAHGGDEYDILVDDDGPLLQLHGMLEDMNHGALRDETIPVANGVLIWLQTEKIEQVIEHLQQTQVPLEKEPYTNPFSGAREVWLSDPDGYPLVISGVPNKSSRP